MNRLREVIDAPTLIVYYCRECQKIVKGVSKGKKEKYSFVCPDGGHECFYGTARSLIHFLRIKENSENGQLLLKMQQEKLAELGHASEESPNVPKEA
jgi:hypothetical protein